MYVANNSLKIVIMLFKVNLHNVYKIALNMDIQMKIIGHVYQNAINIYFNRVIISLYVFN